MIPRSKVDFIKPQVPIPATDWNIAFEELRQNRPLVVASQTGGGWTHPWKPTAQWNSGARRWEIRIQPGFVDAAGGREVEVTMDISDDLPPATVSRYRESVWEGETVGERVQAFLTEEPQIPVTSFRSIGPDATGSSVQIDASLSGKVQFEPVPPFFEALGVGDPPSVTISTLGIETDTTLRDRSEERLLRAFDIVLSQERAGTGTQWDIDNGADGTIARFDVTYTNTEYRRNPYISIRPKWLPPVRTDIVDRLSGDWQDEPIDSLLVATGYLLSPPGALYGSEPDASWTPFFRNYVFWNLDYATNVLPVKGGIEPLEFKAPPLAAGVAGGLFNAFVAANNDALQAASELVTRRSIEGKFWTV